MKFLINAARKLDFLEILLPKEFRLPLRFYGQKILGALEVEMKYLPLLVEPNSVCIDIGANRGIYSFALAKLANHVYSFEPIIELCNYINYYKNEKITVINSALADKKCDAILKIPFDKKRKVTTRASLVYSNNKQEENRKVKVNKLDFFSYERVSFIKIDVEGAEEKVILGGLKTIEKNKPILLIEVTYTGKNINNCKNIIDVLNKYNYKAIIFDENGPRRFSIDSYYFHRESRNILFIPLNILNKKFNNLYE